MKPTGWQLRLGPPHDALVPVEKSEGGMLSVGIPGGLWVTASFPGAPVAIDADVIEGMATLARDKAGCEVTVVRPGTRDDEVLARLAAIEQAVARIEAKLSAPAPAPAKKVAGDESVCGVSFIPEGYTRPYVCDGPKGHSDGHATGHPGWSERQISGKRESTGGTER